MFANLTKLRPLYSSYSRFFSNNKQVRIIKSHSNSIYWNLATEEYLFESPDLQYPTLYLYREDKTIIIGRHQNPWKECFLQEMKKDNVTLCRRKSGGGAVYQDLGNTCFSFLTPMETEHSPDKVKQQDNEILISALKNLGVEAQASGRNDLVILDNKKISGSAFKFNLGKADGSGKKYLHHGTMLIDVDLDVLKNYLNVNKEKLKSKGITSVRARVENLVNVNPEINHDTLSNEIIKEFLSKYDGYEYTVTGLTEEDMRGIPEVKRIYEEMTSWEWLYQKSPDFTNELETRFDWGVIDVQVEVKGNLITSGKVFSDCLFPDFIDNFNDLIQSGTFHYDEDGMHKLCNALALRVGDNPTQLKFIDDLKKWLPTAL